MCSALVHEPLISLFQIVFYLHSQTPQLVLDSRGKILNRRFDGGDVMLFGLGGELTGCVPDFFFDLFPEFRDGFSACCVCLTGAFLEKLFDVVDCLLQILFSERHKILMHPVQTLLFIF
ncbi:hypothetical protein BOVATA_014810 [Babesia ovata]|uniref:Uncharacterized protein n=1 Tax=Babesia ovata TaxID=189622 RepID=A0A2H6KAH0_9APIC|nr:uncharacterized protein BOVATA_014810 [Babesia ovata]GBE59988.1 hypothetical protein BOVATA_014810 [Babesia ovata]